MRLNTLQGFIVALDPAHHQSAFKQSHD